MAPWHTDPVEIAKLSRWMADRGATGTEIADMNDEPSAYDDVYRFMDQHSDPCIFGWVCKIVECDRCHEKTPDCRLENVDTPDDEYPALCEECRKKAAA